MGTGTRSIKISLSQQCFDLLADAMCEFSKRSGRFQTFRTTTHQACKGIQRSGIDRAALDQFFAEISVAGTIVVWLEIKPDWIGDYEDVRREIIEIVGKSLRDKDIISIVMHQALENQLF